MWQIKQVQHIDLSTLMDELRLQLEEVKPRIEKKAFHELFILEKNNEIMGLSLSWLNSFHPKAKICKSLYNFRLYRDKVADSFI